jgi:hypothetical protein
MRFPNDVSLLDEARRKTEKIIDALHEEAPAGYAKPRTYRTQARKAFLAFIRNRKPRETTIRNAIRKQLQYVERNLKYCQEYRIRLSGPKQGRPLKEREKNRERLWQQRRTEWEDERTRIAVEGKFGEAKRRYSLDRIGMKLRETSESAIQLVFLVMNLMVLYRRKVKAFFVSLVETLFELVRKSFTTQNRQLLAA